MEIQNALNYETLSAVLNVSGHLDIWIRGHMTGEIYTHILQWEKLQIKDIQPYLFSIMFFLKVVHINE